MARYDMPAMFGPSLLPDQSEVKGTFVAAISFETERAAALPLLPRFFELPETPVVTFTYIDYPSLEYLGGRGYHELVVAVSAVFKGENEEIRSGFAPVMWVDQPGALISGREYMGFGKLFGGFEADRSEDHVQFLCSEYDAPLVEGTASGLKPVSVQGMARINAGAAHVNSLGWKYITNGGDNPDADYPLVNVTRWDYKRAWSGEGKLNFKTPSATEAPLSSRIMATLSALPVVAWRRSFVAEGDMVIDRTGTRRLTETAMA
jgi:acetoacetate decarboxylase